MRDVLVIGAGPVGLACGIEAVRHNLTVRIIEKGAIVNSLLGYPTNMEFFSTPDLLEIGDHPFATHRYKPLREEGIDYYRRVAKVEQLDIRLYERVLSVDGARGNFTILTDKAEHRSRTIVVATGFFDEVNPLDVPGEDLPKVTHYYREPYQYTGQNVAIIGAKNSAAKAALQCHRNGAHVTLIVRGSEIGESVKYWIRPDLVNRIREGSIRALFNSRVTRISPDSISVESPDGPLVLENDWVLALTGYRPDFAFIESLGIRLDDDPDRTPILDPESYETTTPGIHMAGTVCGGLNTSRWFIENGRFHARRIMESIQKFREHPKPDAPDPDREPA